MGTLAEHVVPHSNNPGIEMMLVEENGNMIWGNEANDVPNQEWSKLDENFTNAGYREGITAGKESAVQEGFDEGFAQVGAPLGRQLGVLRGAANAAMGFLSSRMLPAGKDPGVLERHKGEIWSVIGALGLVNLEDLVPPDLEAEKHAKEHLDQGMILHDNPVTPGVDAHAIGGSKSVRENIDSPKKGPPVPRKPAVEEVNRLRMRLSGILKEIGLDLSLV